MPGPAALVGLLVLCVVSAASLLGRPASTLRVVVLLMVGQTFIHGWLTALNGHRGDPPLTRTRVSTAPVPQFQMPTADGRRTGSLYDQMSTAHPGVTPTQLTVPAPIQHLLADLTGPHALMALAHLAAAAAIGAWLAMGERALWTVVVLMSDGVREAVRRFVVAYYRVLGAAGWVGTASRVRRPLTLVTIQFSCPPIRELFLSRCVVRRGPPALLAA